MCLVHQVLPTARGVPGWSPIQVLTPLDGAWLRWSDGNRYVTAAWPCLEGIVVFHNSQRPTFPQQQSQFATQLSTCIDLQLGIELLGGSCVLTPMYWYGARLGKRDGAALADWDAEKCWLMKDKPHGQIWICEGSAWPKRRSRVVTISAKSATTFKVRHLPETGQSKSNQTSTKWTCRSWFEGQNNSTDVNFFWILIDRSWLGTVNYRYNVIRYNVIHGYYVILSVVPPSSI